MPVIGKCHVVLQVLAFGWVMSIEDTTIVQGRAEFLSSRRQPDMSTKSIPFQFYS